MKKAELVSLFPLKVEITNEIIKNADIGNPLNCIGVLALKAGLGKKNDGLNSIDWLFHSGSISSQFDDYEFHYLVIETEERINMMEVTTPKTVTFVIKRVIT